MSVATYITSRVPAFQLRSTHTNVEFEVVNVGAISVHVHSNQVSDDCISGQLEDWICELLEN